VTLPAVPPGRRLGYRLFGPVFDYILHLRPAEWPIMTAHTLVGYALAVGWAGLWHGEALGPLLLGLFAWVVLLNGGTLALNSAFDRDEGDIGYLRAPPPPPRHLALAGFLLMAAGQGLALLLPPLFCWTYAACFALSVLYSVPPIRLKAVAGLDWVINMWGFGTLTPLAGLAVTGAAPATVLRLVLLAFCPLFAALYPLTQLYQYDEDRSRGDRTLALVLGLRLSLQVALGGVILAFGLFAYAGYLSGWGPAPGALVRWGMLAVALAAWLRVLLPWLRDHPIRAPEDHQRGMYEALGAWAVTDIAVLVAWSW
jgi:lycopene elongase/hydratase (dihydrobisanhydrobacterioruberin-forming)